MTIPVWTRTEINKAAMESSRPCCLYPYCSYFAVLELVLGVLAAGVLAGAAGALAVLGADDSDEPLLEPLVLLSLEVDFAAALLP
jgi:hypothetical protein